MDGTNLCLKIVQEKRQLTPSWQNHGLKNSVINFTHKNIKFLCSDDKFTKLDGPHGLSYQEKIGCN